MQLLRLWPIDLDGENSPLLKSKLGMTFATREKVVFNKALHSSLWISKLRVLSSSLSLAIALSTVFSTSGLNTELSGLSGTGFWVSVGLQTTDIVTGLLKRGGPCLVLQHALT